MRPASPHALRLTFKRAFIEYYRGLQSPIIADPTEAFAACHEYLVALRAELGPEEFMRRLDDETTHLVGEVEQDLRRGAKARTSSSLGFAPGSEDLEDRVRECFEYALDRLGDDGLGAS